MYAILYPLLVIWVLLGCCLISGPAIRLLVRKKNHFIWNKEISAFEEGEIIYLGPARQTIPGNKSKDLEIAILSTSPHLVTLLDENMDYNNCLIKPGVQIKTKLYRTPEGKKYIHISIIGSSKYYEIQNRHLLVKGDETGIDNLFKKLINLEPDPYENNSGESTIPAT